MNKTVTANISGFVFHIELEAYDKLNRYLNTIRKYFGDSDGREEIMADIESRIAELFRDRLKENREVVIMADVDEVIAIMGEPEQYVDASEEESQQQQYQYQEEGAQEQDRKRPRRLFRDTEDAVLGGVCSGIAHYFGVDRIWMRILFLIAFFGFGTGVVIYIILWIIIPEAITTSEKLEMRGEPINVDNIGKTIKDEFGNIKKKVETNNTGRQVSNGIEQIGAFFLKVFGLFFKFITKFIGVIFIIIGVCFLIALVTGIFGSTIFLQTLNHDIPDILGHDFSGMFFETGWLYWLSIVGILMVVAIPILGILYAGIRIIFNIEHQIKSVGISLASLWVIGVIILFVTGTYWARDISSQQNEYSYAEFQEPQSDTLYLGMLQPDFDRAGDVLFINDDRYQGVYIKDGQLYLGNTEVDVKRSYSDSVEVEVIRASRGRDRRAAQDLAGNIDYDHVFRDSLILISPYYHINENDPFRFQELKINIRLPKGKIIFFKEGAQHIIYDVQCEPWTRDRRMIGRYWKMGESKLQCTDCNKKADDELEEEAEAEEETDVFEGEEV